MIDRTIKASQSDNNWVAHPMHISPFAGSSSPHGYNITQIRTAYNLPSSGGDGATIAIIDAYDTPNIINDYTAFCNQFSLPNNSTGNLIVHKMSGTVGTDSNWAMETCLDVEWAHAIAPGAKILLVEATSDSDTALLAAVDYATSQQNVVAVSMSWGGQEFGGETSDSYESHFIKPGITFFASSGDDGSYVNWPAASANVVSVGGTTLKINASGGVISETAWTNSSGGVSNYEAIPSFQTSLGLSYPNRAVPDVSYNADPSTGVAIRYNNQWYVVGGTSAGAPQWAAIDALGLDANNPNLYARAKTAYTSYFRDIINGSNFVNSAGTGYDLVTGLGSPLTTDFGTELTVSPSSGPAGGQITFSGEGLTPNSSANISWLNSSTWVPMANNVATDSNGNLTYILNAPDLMQNNPAGDNQPSFNNIAFRIQDNTNNRSYNASIPYTEWRRGLTQVGNQSAIGIYGNNTDLTTSVLLQSGQSMIVAGNWFSPGTASIFWDGTTSIGTSPIDATGQFNTTAQVPAAETGQHTLTISDGAANFSINLTRLPTVANNYTAGWQTTDTTINLTPDSTVNETFYKINSGPIYNVTANGQPVITTEGNNNTLEYWSTWNIYGTNSIMELPHVTLTGIQLQKTAPEGSIQISNGETSTFDNSVILTVTANDSISGINQIRFSNDGIWDQVPWQQYTTTVSWQLTIGEGLKTVYFQVIDNAGLTSNFNASILLNSQPLLVSQTISPSTTANPSPTPSQSPTQTFTPNLPQVSTPSETPSLKPSSIPQAPEFTFEMIIVLLVLTTLSLAAVFKRKRM